MAAAILQRGCNGRQGRRRGESDNNESSSNSNKYPLLPLAMVKDDERLWYISLLTKDGDMEPFYVCDFFTLISSVPVGRSEGPTKLLRMCKIYS